ncbi:2,3-bisphosphoglycerate-independent phosphoglycerate mutase [Candidatus Dojkabacteria bacterium]|nr:2,3-bisphosphoglycerate-independent phosphoglycerate mutase [Candidatus Dojkabacteria bacterium]
MLKIKPKKVIMLILDGWGIAKPDKYNAIDNAKTPNFDRLMREYPNIQLRADGPYVGLPEGQFGTSEINHGVIGTGQVVLQDLPKINNAIEDKTFFANKTLIEACNHVKKHKSDLHIAGILSDGNVHCSIEHAIATIELAAQEKVENVYFHAFTDGRDTPPKSAEKYLKQIQKALDAGKFKKAAISTVQGRFYLDRDREWAKTEKAVDLMLKGEGMKVNDYQAAVDFSYNRNVSDEFFQQFIIDPEGLVNEKDALIFFHYRTDRMFQIQKMILDRKVKDLKVVSFVSVFEGDKTDVAFPRTLITQTLAKTISDAGKTQLHMTETEKFAHLTFFFNAGKETEFDGEDWAMMESNRFVKPFYNLAPSMQADKITNKLLVAIEKDQYDFTLVNYSNTDMVGHTGSYEGAVVAAECVDYAIGIIYEQIKDRLNEYVLIITADHGNSDIMWDYENDQPHTQHTTSPVPFILISDIDCKLDPRESLEDIAPTVLELMDIKKPDVMKGSSLIVTKN